MSRKKPLHVISIFLGHLIYFLKVKPEINAILNSQTNHTVFETGDRCDAPVAIVF
jgi:hypothetical protein